MRAITVRQPWAWAIMHGGKDVENRTRNIAGSYRGPVVIHAGLAIDTPGSTDPRIGAAIRRLYVEPRREVESVQSLAGGDDPWEVTSPWFGYRGAALGVVELVGVHHADDCWDDYPIGPFQRLSGYCSEWAQEDCYHLILREPRWFPEPIPYRGALGLWHFPDELLPEGFR